MSGFLQYIWSQQSYKRHATKIQKAQVALTSL